MTKYSKLIVIPVLMALIFTGCKKNKDGDDTATANDANSTAVVNEQESNEPAENPEVTEETTDETLNELTTVPENPELLHVNLAYESMNYFNSEDDVNKNVADYEIQYALLTDDSKEKYPALEATLEAREKKIKDGMDDQILGYKRMYEDDKEHFDSSDVSLSDKTKSYIVRADSNVFSVVDDWYGYYGGVHGMYGKWGFNYDSQTGEELKFSEVVLDTDRFLRIANEKISEAFGGFEATADVVEYVKDMDLDTELKWWIDYQGVTIYFGPYELGSYAMGAPYATLYFNEYPELFNEKYTEIPDSYVMPFTDNNSMFFDMDGDGVLDFISIIDNEDDGPGSMYVSTEISVGAESLSIEDYYYSSENYLVCKDGKFFVVSFRESEGGYTYCRVFDINNMTTDDEQYYIRTAHLGSSFEEKDGGISFYRYKTAALTDPDCINMNKTTDFLGSMSGSLIYHMDKNGKMESDTPQMEFNDSYPIEIKRDYECKQVNLDGNVVGKATLKKGTWFLVVRGDGETYADVIEIPASKIKHEDWLPTVSERPTINENSKLYRLEGKYEDNSYTLMFGEYEDYELFDNLFYAD